MIFVYYLYYTSMMRMIILARTTDGVCLRFRVKLISFDFVQLLLLLQNRLTIIFPRHFTLVSQCYYNLDQIRKAGSAKDQTTRLCGVLGKQKRGRGRGRNFENSLNTRAVCNPE